MLVFYSSSSMAEKDNATMTATALYNICIDNQYACNMYFIGYVHGLVIGSATDIKEKISGEDVKTSFLISYTIAKAHNNQEFLNRDAYLTVGRSLVDKGFLENKNESIWSRWGSKLKAIREIIRS